jgi:hypothetical protein
MAKPIQDTIQFVLSSEEVVVNTTVKINASMVAIVTTDMTEQRLKEAIRDVVKKFIPTADWQFSGMSRTSHASGMEQVTLNATARIPEADNYALDRRSKEASVDGISIHTVATDNSPTAGQIETTQRKLRLELLEKAQQEADAINEATGMDYRLGEVIFDPESASTANVRNNRMMASATYGAGFDQPLGGGGGDIGNAVKLTMLARVILRQHAPAS